MPASREIRITLSLLDTVMRLILTAPFTAPFTALGILLLTLASNLTLVSGLALVSSLKVDILGVLCLLTFGITTLDSLVKLVFWRLFQQPILTMNTTGITYSSPRMPWHSIVVPWDDVTRMSVFRQRAGPYARTAFLVHTKHPLRYISPIRQRVTAWWNPALQGATISISLASLDIGITRAQRRPTLERIKKTFAREIIQHDITVAMEV